MAADPEIVRRKILAIGEAVSRLRATVDVRPVHAGLGRLDDFEAFVADVEGWLARAGR